MPKIHIVPREGYWAVKRDDVETTFSRHSTQKEAIDAGRDLGKREKIEFTVDPDVEAAEEDGR